MAQVQYFIYYSAWIQSAEYSDRYPDTLVKKSYNSVGKNKKVDKSIILYASDAAWVTITVSTRQFLK